MRRLKAKVCALCERAFSARHGSTLYCDGCRHGLPEGLRQELMREKRKRQA